MGTIRTLLGEVKQYKSASIATPLFMILEVMMEMAIPFLMASIIDEGVNAGDIGGAEDRLYQRAEPEDRRYLELAVDFYSRLNDLSDEQLEQGGFARDEVQDGLRNLAAQFGVSLL